MKAYCPPTWKDLETGQKSRPLEWVAEKLIFVVSLSAILMVLLIFLFVTREAMPILLGRMNSAAVVARDTIPVSEMDKLSPEKLGEYLQMSPAEIKKADKETL